MFEAKGVRPFSPYTGTYAASGGMTMPDSLSNNGTDWSYGYGLKIGMHAPINEMFSIRCDVPDQDQHDGLRRLL